MTLHIYCYNKFKDRFKALDYVPEDHRVWTETDLAGGSGFLYPSQEGAKRIIELYEKDRLKFFVTSNGDLLNHLLNTVVEEKQQLDLRVYWYDTVHDTFRESRLNSEGYLSNWPFGYLY